MIVIRDIFQLKFGKAREAKSLWKEGAGILSNAGYKVDRILTDLTGPYYTMVLESSYKSLTDYEKAVSQEASSEDWRKFYRKFVELVYSGRREIFTVEQF